MSYGTNSFLKFMKAHQLVMRRLNHTLKSKIIIFQQILLLLITMKEYFLSKKYWYNIFRITSAAHRTKWHEMDKFLLIWCVAKIL